MEVGVPLSADIINTVTNYCDRDLPSADRYESMFDFLDEEPLRLAIIQEFKAARYIYKLMEALQATDLRLHAHVKFQITQYASIYEAIIVHLLWTKFENHPEVQRIEMHKEFRKIAEWPKNLDVSSDGEAVYLCRSAQAKTPKISIKFDDKVCTEMVIT